MRKIIVTVTVVTLILSILSTGIFALLPSPSPANTGVATTVSGE